MGGLAQWYPEVGTQCPPLAQRYPAPSGMADNVTYADVRFVKHPKTPQHRPPRTDLKDNADITYAHIKITPAANVARTLENDVGDVTYANVRDIQKSGGKSLHDDPAVWTKAPGAWWTALTPYTAHILLAACVLLLVTATALGVRFSQVSMQVRESTLHLQQLEQRAENQNLTLGQSIQEHVKTQGSLRGTKQLLNQSQDQLHRTEEKLKETEKTLSSTQYQFRNKENDLVNCNNVLKRTSEDLNREQQNSNDLFKQNHETKAQLENVESDLKKCQNNLKNTNNSLKKATDVLNTNSLKLNKIKQNLKNAKKMLADGNYLAASSCMNTLLAIEHFSESTESFRYCPSGWILISGKCYFLSENKEDKDDSKKACSSLRSKLAVIKPSDTNLQSILRKTLQDFLTALKRDNSQRIWSDGLEETESTGNCWGMNLEKGPVLERCYTLLRFFCEKEESMCHLWERFEDCIKRY